MDRSKFVLAGLAILGLSVSLHSAESPEQKDPVWNAQIRLRTEGDGKSTNDTSTFLLSTQMRSRLGVTLTPSPAVEMKLELQDSRHFGSEPSVLGNATSATVGDSKGLDLHQGYVTLKGCGLSVTAGRQSLALGSERFISSLEWHPVARTFDGLSARWTSGSSSLTTLGLLVRDVDVRQQDDGDHLAGLHYAYVGSPILNAEVYGFYDQSRLAYRTQPNYDLVYLGERLKGQAGLVTYEEEFIYQGGETGKLTSSAFYLALRVGAKLPKVSGNMGLDMMSGDDKATDGNNHTYNANYYFAHSFFGWMDYFTANPTEGVADYRLDVEANPTPAWKLKAEYHFFTPQNAIAAQDDPFGSEVDLEFHSLHLAKTDIAFGVGLFFPGDSAIRIPAAKGKDQMGTFIYLMPTFGF